MRTVALCPLAAVLLWTGGHAQAGWPFSSSTVHAMHGAVEWGSACYEPSSVLRWGR